MAGSCRVVAKYRCSALTGGVGYSFRDGGVVAVRENHQNRRVGGPEGGQQESIQRSKASDGKTAR